MAKAHRKTAVAKRQHKVLQIPQNVADSRRRQKVNFFTLDYCLDTIEAISDVLDHTSDICQNQEGNTSIITAGLSEALKVVHHKMVAGVGVRS